ncbi:hypothetical protein GCM10009821_25920 [Aeromicrobium halocynthiae]|uniref:NAD-dependent epimerase/dehydratase domain-containing protein n=1 Tax=Aeromicrobium halocynthiae TaxID=560557 RepID=A0ABP5HPL5_9ACTN
MTGRADNLDQVLDNLRSSAPPRGEQVDAATLERLRRLSTTLVRAHGGAVREYRRSRTVAPRDIDLPVERIRRAVAHRGVLLSGETARMGPALVEALRALGPTRTCLLDDASTGRGSSARIDLVDPSAVAHAVGVLRPDIVVHLVGHTGLDDRYRHRWGEHAAATTILGTRHVVEAAVAARVGTLVLGTSERSTSLYSDDPLIASERIAQMIVVDAASRGLLRAAIARSGLVVDPVAATRWLRRASCDDTVLPLPPPEKSVHVQARRDSVRLLLAAIHGASTSSAGLHAVRSLDDPVRPLDLVVGLMADENLAVVPLAIDPAPVDGCRSVGDRIGPAGSSALLNALEVSLVVPSAAPGVDLVPVRFRLPAAAARLVDHLGHLAARDAGEIPDVIDQLARIVLEGTLAQASAATLRQVARMSQRDGPAMSGTDRMVDDRVRWWAGR